jgi:DNA-3-methyladenine glycosylase
MAVSRRRLAGTAVDVAPLLLGARLRSRIDGDEIVVRLTEVEAYEGQLDAASHAFRGRTARNSVMFGQAGHLYCYFVYGMHWCANITCGGRGTAAAVLLRAGEVVEGVEVARRRTPVPLPEHKLGSGPARLARILALDGHYTGVDLIGSRRDSSQTDAVELLNLGAVGQPILSGPRVGIRVAAELPWRFWLAGERSVSAFRPLRARPAQSSSPNGI